MNITRYSYLTNPGGRRENEDSVLIRKINSSTAAVVADGLGGHGGGGLASRAAVKTVLNCFAEGQCRTTEGIAHTIGQANDAVLSCQTEDCKMKTTLVCLFLEDGVAEWVHVGDSRLYHFIDRRLSSRTLDHSVPQLAVSMGMITEGQIRFHEDRNRLLRALGSDSREPDISGPVSLARGFHSFLLCTDGFWEYVLEEEMERTLAESESPEKWLGRMEQLLRAKAPEKNDNYTAAAVFHFAG